MSLTSTDLYGCAQATLANFVVTTSFAFVRLALVGDPWVLSQAQKTRAADSNLSKFDAVRHNSPASGSEAYLLGNLKLDLISIKDSDQWLKALISLFAASLLITLPVRDR